VLRGPGAGISVEVDGAENKEGERQGATCYEDDPLTGCGFEQKDTAEAEARGHDGDPWDEGIPDDNEHPQNRKSAGLVEQIPKRGVVAEGRGVDVVEKIVQRDDRDTEEGQKAIGKLH
jgi:hypothetical protein